MGVSYIHARDIFLIQQDKKGLIIEEEGQPEEK